MATPNPFRQARVARKLTQAELAIAAVVSERTIRKLENGDNVSFETVKAVRSVLEMDDAEIVQERIEDERPRPRRRLSEMAIAWLRWAARLYAACFSIQVLLLFLKVYQGPRVGMIAQAVVVCSIFVCLVYVGRMRRDLVDENSSRTITSFMLPISVASGMAVGCCLMFLKPFDSSPDNAAFYLVCLPSVFLEVAHHWILGWDRDPSTGLRPNPYTGTRKWYDPRRMVDAASSLANAGRSFAVQLLR